MSSSSDLQAQYIDCTLAFDYGACALTLAREGGYTLTLTREGSCTLTLALLLEVGSALPDLDYTDSTLNGLLPSLTVFP